MTLPKIKHVRARFIGALPQRKGLAAGIITTGEEITGLMTISPLP